jgi:hypothetical protein
MKNAYKWRKKMSMFGGAVSMAALYGCQSLPQQTKFVQQPPWEKPTLPPQLATKQDANLTQRLQTLLSESPRTATRQSND